VLDGGVMYYYEEKSDQPPYGRSLKGNVADDDGDDIGNICSVYSLLFL
jgi:hypothetical protein